MSRSSVTALAALSAAGMIAVSTVSPASPPPGALPASVRPFSATVLDRDFPARDADGGTLPLERWRVVTGTGNCCENYIATTSRGAIYDFGGSYVRFSTDVGTTWSEVAGVSPVGFGEGAVVEAPGGDVVGVTWDPYSGDRVEGFKFDARDGAWYHAQNRLHSPHPDRPYVAILPGPYRLGAATVPYLTYMVAGTNAEVNNQYSSRVSHWSTDGVNYVPAPSPFVPTGPPVSKYLDLPAAPGFDWLQPLTVPGVVPLSGGGALAWNARADDTLDLSILEAPGTTWAPFSFPNQPRPKGRLLVDSKGRIHNAWVNAQSFSYRISSDGGRTWKGAEIPLPPGFENMMAYFDRFWDFKTAADLEMSAISLYARRSSAATDQSLAFILSTEGGAPRLHKVLFLGKGDKALQSGVLATGDRLDFVTLGILPDGRIATTYMDADHRQPALAVTAASQRPGAAPAPDAAATATPTPSPATPTPTPAPVTPTPAPATPSPTPAATPSPTPAPTEPPDEEPPALTGVGDRPDPFSPNGDGRRDRTRIRFTVSEDASVTVAVLTRRGRLVRTLESDWWVDAGSYAVAWAGRNDAGKRVSARKYVYRITATDMAGNEATPVEGRVTVRSG